MTTNLYAMNHTTGRSAIASVARAPIFVDVTPTGLIERLAGAAAATFEVLVTWNERQRQRFQMAEIDARGRADMGLSRADVAHETGKAFWQA